MLMEEQEINDWDVSPDDNNEIRKQKSISAYWLNNWYDSIKEHTFKTIIYESIEEVPEILPFEKCMVRYENKSPKDSEFWGPVSTKKELEQIFYTSLRCKTNMGKYYCVREWIDLGDEYRCFWNNGLVAISSESKNQPPTEQIINYINLIKDKIKYNRCVFDLAHIKETNDLIFIEYNSWETNSGAHRFDWNIDREIFYCSENIVIRWDGGEVLVKNDSIKKYIVQSDNYEKFIMDTNKYEFIQLIYPSNYLITDKYIYVSNDVWLGRFDLNLKPLNWIGGSYRFNGIELCVDGCICVGDKYYYYDLTPKSTKSVKIKKSILIENKINLKYGIPVKNKITNEIMFVRMLDSCELVLLKK
jgi:hypothetical protein